MDWRVPIKRCTRWSATRCGRNCRCPGDRIEKHPEERATFPANFSSILQAKLTAGQSVLPPVTERPLRIFCQDESRFGLLPIQRRRITLTGVKPLGAVQYCFENFYVYGAVEPTTGECFGLALPHLNSVNFQLFLNEFA